MSTALWILVCVVVGLPALLVWLLLVGWLLWMIERTDDE